MWLASHWPWEIGHHPVVASLPDVDRDADRGQLEAPRPDERHVVVEPAPIGLAQRLAEVSGHPLGEVTRQDPAIHVVHEVPEGFRDGIRGHHAPRGACSLLEWDQRLWSFQRGGELLEILLAHALEEVDPFSWIGRHAGDRRGGADPIREQCRAGQRVGSATGPADGEGGVGADMVEHRRRVIHDVGNGPALAP